MANQDSHVSVSDMQLSSTFEPFPVSQSEQPASFSQRAYRHLLGQIMEQRLHPGDEVNRKSLARELEVSLAPVNEAVAQLESEGLLEVTPRRQTRVRVIRQEEVRGLLILREAIECQAARMYAGNTVAQHEELLLELASRVDNSQPGTPENEAAECRFHDALVRLVDCPLLSEEFAKVMRRKFFLKINALAPWSTQPPLDSHTVLVRKLSKASPDEAESMLREHLQRGRSGILV